MRARTSSALVALVVLAGVASADGSASLADQLATNDPRAVADAVSAIALGSADAALLYAAGRACEDKLADPACALAIYERIFLCRLVRSIPSTPAAREMFHSH